MPVLLPMVKSEAVKLADWLELTAVISASHRASAGDLESVLRKEGFRANRTPRLLADVFADFNARQVAAGQAYPFEVLGTEIVHRHEEEHPAYLFCLCASYLAWSTGAKGSVLSHTRLFEELCVLAAKKFVEGDSIRFGSPRDGLTLPKHFLDAIAEMCRRIGEGQGTRQKRSLRAKDDGLDIVAWREFPDRMMGKLMLLGQCAAGDDWSSKTGDLSPTSFFKYWLKAHPVSPPVRAFFVPHRIPSDEWEKTNNDAGIVFDRCRIAHWIETDPPDNLATYATWADGVLTGARGMRGTAA